MSRPKNPAKVEAIQFVIGGYLRDVLESSRHGKLSQEAIQKIIDAVCFGLGC